MKAPTPLEPPRPAITPAARPFWDALDRQQIVIQRCRSCRSWIHYPRVRCPRCGSAELHFEAVSGSGRVHTFTIARQATTPHFVDEVPQLIAIVELDEGVRLTTTLVTDQPDRLAVGDPVEPIFDVGHDGITLLRYRPSSS